MLHLVYLITITAWTGNKLGKVMGTHVLEVLPTLQRLRECLQVNIWPLFDFRPSFLRRHESILDLILVHYRLYKCIALMPY